MVWARLYLKLTPGFFKYFLFQTYVFFYINWSTYNYYKELVVLFDCLIVDFVRDQDGAPTLFLHLTIGLN